MASDHGSVHTSAAESLPTIGVITSYDPSYDWEREIIAGIEATLAGVAEAEFFHMRTLGVADRDELSRIGREARSWLRTLRPDAIVTTDDNAWRYAIADAVAEIDVPVAFCGVNWPADDGRLLHSGVHGMVEISPADRLLDSLGGVLQPGANAVILAADRPTDRAQVEGFRLHAEARGLQLTTVLVATFSDWCTAFREAHESADFVYVLNSAGIADWDDSAAREIAERHTRVLSATEYAWMSPYAVIATFKSGEEQGEWAALSAMHALAEPSGALGPIVVNHRFRVEINQRLRNSIGHDLPSALTLLAEVNQ